MERTAALTGLVAAFVGCGGAGTTNFNPCSASKPLVCPNQLCCPVGLPFECNGTCYSAPGPCNGSFVCCGPGPSSCGSGTYWDQSTCACQLAGGGGSGGGGSSGGQGVIITVNAAVDEMNLPKTLPNGQAYGWYVLYYNLSPTPATPSRGWQAVNAVCANPADAMPYNCCLNGCSHLPLTVTMSNQPATVGQSVYAFAYWSIDGASSGPGASDPHGSAAIAVVAGQLVYNVSIGLTSP